MKPEDLLVLARDLTRRETGKPKSVSLRRAVSSSYYALFHALARLCADRLVGRSKQWSLYTPVYRALDHKKTFIVLGSRDRSTAAVADAFKNLQEARHEADYSPEPFSYNRDGTVDLIDSAERAIATLDALSPDERLALAIKLVIKAR